MHKTLDELCYLLEDELKKIVAKNDITPDELEHVSKAMKILLKIKEYEAMTEYDIPQGYYGRSMGNERSGHWRAQGYYDRPQNTYRRDDYRDMPDRSMDKSWNYNDSMMPGV